MHLTSDYSICPSLLNDFSAYYCKKRITHLVRLLCSSSISEIQIKIIMCGCYKTVSTPAIINL